MTLTPQNLLPRQTNSHKIVDHFLPLSEEAGGAGEKVAVEAVVLHGH